ncbi:hypothetical protein J7M23_03260 [Candidatus Sumerlaeota bacterium]|nr:hypothetical protein [Candidatus Sumerlaeota bacterium]
MWQLLRKIRRILVYLFTKFIPFTVILNQTLSISQNFKESQIELLALVKGIYNAERKTGVGKENLLKISVKGTHPRAYQNTIYAKLKMIHFFAGVGVIIQIETF